MGANDNSVSFTNSITLNGFSQNGNALTFNNLTLNGVTSNFTVTAIGANIVISNYDLNSSISYTVSGSGSQTFSVNKSPASVDIDGSIPASLEMAGATRMEKSWSQALPLR